MGKCGSKTRTRLTRRDFLKRTVTTTAAAITVPWLVPASALGTYAPSNRITLGFIGTGGMGSNNLQGFLPKEEVHVLAVCDVEKGSDQYGHWFNRGGWLGREPAQKRTEDFYAQKNGRGSYKGCDGYVDFRDLLERADIDAVVISTPDHWHAIPAIMAAQAGKDIYGEKPLSLTIAEGRAMVKAVKRYGVVFQTGTHHRSVDQHLRYVCELIRNGRIGTLKKIISHIGDNNRESPPVPWKPMPIPNGFDYKMWLGPAPLVPYHRARCHYSFRFVLDYSGGQTTNLGVHALDICQWANNTEHTGPIEIEDMGSEFPQDGLFNTATKVGFRARYANGVELICKTNTDGLTARFEGTEGWIETTYKTFRTYPQSLKTSVIKPNEINLYKSTDHKQNFIDCVKSRREPITPVEVGHRSTSVCLLGNIAMLLKRKIRWDPQNECFINDDQANRMLSKPLRAPWKL